VGNYYYYYTCVLNAQAPSGVHGQHHITPSASESRRRETNRTFLDPKVEAWGNSKKTPEIEDNQWLVDIHLIVGLSIKCLIGCNLAEVSKSEPNDLMHLVFDGNGSGRLITDCPTLDDADQALFQFVLGLVMTG